jgi:hypothetical protein
MVTRTCLNVTFIPKFPVFFYYNTDGAGIATRLTGWTIRCSNPDRDKIFFSALKLTDRLWGPPSLPFSAYRDSSPGVKRPGRKVDHSCLSSSKFRNEWIYNFCFPCLASWRGQGKIIFFTLLWHRLQDICCLPCWFLISQPLHVCVLLLTCCLFSSHQ